MKRKRVILAGIFVIQWRIGRLLRAIGVTAETYEKEGPESLVGKECHTRLGIENIPGMGRRYLRVVDFEL